MIRLWSLMLAVLCSGLAACSQDVPPDPAAAEVRPGSLYSVRGPDGAFRVAKVLVVDGMALHVRLYRNRFSERPTAVDPAKLELGKPLDGGEMGMGHLPLTRGAFFGWDPVLLRSASVLPEELEEYEVWKKDGGGLIEKW